VDNKSDNSLAIVFIESQDERKIDFKTVSEEFSEQSRNMRIHVPLIGNANYKGILSSFIISRGHKSKLL